VRWQFVGKLRRVQWQTVEYPVNIDTSLTWQKPRRIPRRARLSLVATVSGAGAVASATRFVRAP